MMTALTMLETLKRPRLLINAARIGTQEYRREAHLGRHLGDQELPTSDVALHRLILLEDEMNTERCQRLASYSVARHVDLLIAIMGEARQVRAMESA